MNFTTKRKKELYLVLAKAQRQGCIVEDAPDDNQVNEFCWNMTTLHKELLELEKKPENQEKQGHPDPMDPIDSF